MCAGLARAAYHKFRDLRKTIFRIRSHQGIIPVQTIVENSAAVSTAHFNIKLRYTMLKHDAS